MKRGEKILNISIAILAVGFICYIGLTNWNGKAATVQASQIQLPELRTNEAVTVDFAEKPTVISLFTSWCTYCNEDAPKMAALHEKYKDRINLIGINITNRDDLSEVRAYAERHALAYPILLDLKGDVYARYGGDGFPALYFVNTEGKVTDSIIGSTDLETLDSSFRKLLKNG
ncbi:TlpA disulfide reductase family protein [Paenibacillus sp. LHD-117]|uniref:TlpA family protein disulfide reductase n=1 Tax=Paenibacillus sp. LHD-117 TaxID=3071412 RepID=UPI0027E08B2B|nr:TlpA disulfide reductase family protein [Paenibacillus sp. LHD-117]MDQ6421745.1 TlpA disulfide reductase family protein [Paenibacillus sp. LHD-117]